MVSVFDSATALLSTDFVDKFSIERLTNVLSKVGKETGAKIDRNKQGIIVVGKWSRILESHDILLDELRNVNVWSDDNTVEYDDGLSEDVADDSNEKSGQASGKYSTSSSQLEPIAYQNYFNPALPGLASIFAKEHVGGPSDFTKLISDTSKQNRLNETVTDFKEQSTSSKTEQSTSTKIEQDIDDENVMVKVENMPDSSVRETVSFGDERDVRDTSRPIKQEPVVEGENTGQAKSQSSLGIDVGEAVKTMLFKDKFSCSECDYIGKDKSTLKAHRRRRHLKKFSCDKCSSSFGYNKDLNRHKQTVHAEGGVVSKRNKRGRKKEPKEPKDPYETFPCTECPYIGKTKTLLKEHKRRLHDIRFHCDQCDKSFGYNKDLNRHKRHVHVLASYSCDQCSPRKLFKTKRALDVHSRCHEENYDKHAFECQVCGKRYSTKYVLDYHVKAEHLGMKKSYTCPICGRSFTQKGSYRQHANVHAGIRPWVCDVCGKTFSYENGLRAHRFLHSSTPSFQCNVCGKKFLQKNSVTIHMKSHQTIHDHMCMTCGRTFSQKQSLIRHERIHTGDKPFSCSLCHKIFRDASIIRRHMILIHKKDPKKWREDVVNNARKSEHFYIDVLVGDNACSASDKNINDTSLKTLPAITMITNEQGLTVPEQPIAQLPETGTNLNWAS